MTEYEPAGGAAGAGSGQVRAERTTVAKPSSRWEPPMARPGRGSAWPQALEGARDITPLVIGVVPLAITIGVLMSTSSLSTAQAVASGPIILAGTSQLAALHLLAAGAAPQVIVLSAIVVNVRMLLYGAAFAPWFEHERPRKRLLLAIPIVDQLYFTCTARFDRRDLDGRGRRAYYTGAAVWLYGVWWLWQLAAYAVGPSLLDAADAVTVLAPLGLVGLVATSTTTRSASAAAGAAAAAAWLLHGVPFNGGLPLAVVVGVVVGSLGVGDRPQARGHR